MLEDGKWHNRALVRNSWKQLIPPEYFARRAPQRPYFSTKEGKFVAYKRSFNAVATVEFAKTVRHSLKSGYVEVRDLTTKRLENYDVKITEKGKRRLLGRKERHHLITLNGETNNIAYWCRTLNLNENKFRKHILNGVTPDKAAEMSKAGLPPARSKLITHNGTTKTLTEWCLIYNVDRARFGHHLKNKTFEGAIEACQKPSRQSRQS